GRALGSPLAPCTTLFRAVCHQCLVAAGEESTWVVEPLQGGARGYQVGLSGEVESFGITRQEADAGSARSASLPDAFLRLAAEVVDRRSTRLNARHVPLPH